LLAFDSIQGLHRDVGLLLLGHVRRLWHRNPVALDIGVVGVPSRTLVRTWIPSDPDTAGTSQ
jgi:hypothetical protein